MFTKNIKRPAEKIFSHITTPLHNALQAKMDLIVFSHLRWNFVTQRPQHIIGRLSQYRKVLFVEEPISSDEKSFGTGHIISINEHIKVLQPRLEQHFSPTALSSIVNTYINRYKLKNSILWFYSAAFVNVIPHIAHSLIVYDCMDELSMFKNASPELVAQEKNLMHKADVIFTGGKSLYESKKQYSDSVYCFPSSVDIKHFQNKKNIKMFHDIRKIPAPIVGFYGVIDERIDLELLKKVAKALPMVSFVMIGPVVKINESDLPRCDNVYYLGNKPYEVLPSYLSKFDIAMMPFALNDATKYISPTKTLEFMAAQKPIISTPIYDVVRDYKNEVLISRTTSEFVKGVVYYLNEPESAKKKRLRLQKDVIAKTSWDKTAQHMEEIMRKIAVEKKIDVPNKNQFLNVLPSLYSVYD